MANGENKGLSPVAWIALGCGVLLLLVVAGVVGVVGFGLFKFKQVADDFQEDGEFSISTPEGDVSIDLSGAKDGGGVSIKGPDGEEMSFGGGASLENVPDWVPLYPESTETHGSFHSKTPEGKQGATVAQTQAAPEEVLAYYKEWLEDEGYTIQSESTTNTPEGSMSSISGRLDSPERTLVVTIIAHDKGTQVAVNYGGKE